MKFKIILYCFLLISLSIQAQTNKINEYPEVKAKIKLAELWINELIDYYGLPGAAVGIVYNQELVYSNGFGYSNLENKVRISENTLFRIASISKLFTGTAIMQLRDAGKLHLDDPIKKYIDWFELKKPESHWEDVTIRQLLTHTSGIPREAAFPYWTDRQFPTMQQIQETLPDQTMIFEPETKWKYSNLGISLLGKIIENVSGVTYDEYIHKNIFAPLEMNASRTQIDQDNPNLATGYLYPVENGKKVEALFTDSKGITAAANLSTSISDIAKFISLQFSSDSKVLKQSTLREMHRPHWMRPGWKNGWGLAFSTFYSGSKLYVGHAGWISGYRSQVLFNVDDKVGVVVFLNTEEFNPYKIADRIYKMVADPLKEAFGPEEEKYHFDPLWEKYTGKYVDPTFWYTDVIILNEKLYLYNYGYPPTDNPTDNLTLLYSEGKNTFRNKNGDGELIVFELDDKENVVKIKTGENYIYPVRENK